jgi:hypothetical protein
VSHYVRSLGLAAVPEDPATPEQRARDRFLIAQIGALAEAIRQAKARGDTATAAAMQKTKDKLYAEHLAIQKAIIAQATALKEAAESGALASPLERLAAGIRKYALIGGLLVGAAIIVPPLLRRGGR